MTAVTVVTAVALLVWRSRLDRWTLTPSAAAWGLSVWAAGVALAVGWVGAALL